MNFTICLTVPMKMSKETVQSMLINIIIHISPTCSKSVASWIWLQNLRMLSLLNLLVVFLSYFDEANIRYWLHQNNSKKKYLIFAPYIFITTLICVWAFIFVVCMKCGSYWLVVLMYLFIRNVSCECNFTFQMRCRWDADRFRALVLYLTETCTCACFIVSA